MYFIAMSRTPSLFENKPLAPPPHSYLYLHSGHKIYAMTGMLSTSLVASWGGGGWILVVNG